MAEYRSPLTAVYNRGDYGASTDDGPGVALSEERPGALIQLAGWSNFDAAVAPVLADLGFDAAGQYGTSVAQNGRRLFRIAPDRILITSDSPLPLPQVPQADELAILDLSHSRTCICVEGREAENVMARLAAIDFRASSFPLGGFVQTGIHHIGVLICRSAAQRFDILTPVSWARSTWEMTCLNARPFGYRVAEKA